MEMPASPKRKVIAHIEACIAGCALAFLLFGVLIPSSWGRAVAHAAGIDSLPAGTYTITVTGPDGTPVATGSLIMNSAGVGQIGCPAGTTGTYPNCTPIPGASGGVGGTFASIDGGSTVNTSSRTPVITGSALGFSMVHVTVTAFSATRPAYAANVSVINNGTWRLVVGTSLADGNYSVRVSATTGSPVLASQLLVVNGSSPSASTCPTGTTGVYPNCAGPISSASSTTNSTTGGSSVSGASSQATLPTAQQNTQVATGSTQEDHPVSPSLPGVDPRVAPLCILTTSAESVQEGISMTLAWTTMNVTSVVFTENGTPLTSVALPNGTKTIATAGLANTSRRYVMTATGPMGTVTCSKTFAIRPFVAEPLIPGSAGSSAVSSVFARGGRVATQNNSNIRTSASLTGSLNGVQPMGALGTVLDGPLSADGYVWWKVDFDSSVDGWTVEDNLSASGVSSVSSSQTSNSALNLSTIPIVSANCPANSNGIFPNCTNTIYGPSGNAITQPAVTTINYSQFRPTYLGSAPPGSNLVYFCAADYRAYANQPTSGVYMSAYQPYYAVYGGVGGIYSMYSDLCASAAQAGIITSADGGQFIIQTVVPQAVTGMSAHNITSYNAPSGPAYKFLSSPVGAASPARITGVSATTGQSPFSVTFTVSNIPAGMMNLYTLHTKYTGTSVNAENEGAYVFDQVSNAFATVGTKTLTFTIPGTDEITLWQTEVAPGGGVTYHTLDTKVITVTPPPPSVTVTGQGGNPLYANFQFNWLEPGTYSLDDGANTTYSVTDLGYVGASGNISTARTYGTAGTYTIRLLKAGSVVVTKTITVPVQ